MTVIEGTSVQTVPYDAQDIDHDPVLVTAQAVKDTSATTLDIETLALSAEGRRSADATGISGSVSEKLVEALTSVVTALVELISTFIKRRDVKESETKRGESGSQKEQSASTKTGGTSSASPSSETSKSTSASAPQPSKPTSSMPTGGKESSSAKPAASRLSAIRDDTGVVTVRTLDGFIVKAEPKNHAWSITDPEGKTTRIYGDPHVKESDGDKWDFKRRGTFVFGKNKITVETTPLSNGATITRQITMYSGKERVTIGGIDKNLPTIVALAEDGKQHDDALSDGTIYRRGGTAKGENWSTDLGGKKVVMGGKR